MQFIQLAVAFSFLGLSVSLPLAIDSRKVPDTKELAKAAKMPSASAVMTAAKNFANDANTVSASLNSLGTATDASTIKSLSTKAFKAESDEDAQRAVLAAASGSAGANSNTKIVKNTPTVLDGLAAMMKSPSTKTVNANLATIEDARNPQILPSITQLSNSALKAVGMPQSQQKFPATSGAQN